MINKLGLIWSVFFVFYSLYHIITNSQNSMILVHWVCGGFQLVMAVIFIIMLSKD